MCPFVALVLQIPRKMALHLWKSCTQELCQIKKKKELCQIKETNCFSAIKINLVLMLKIHLTGYQYWLTLEQPWTHSSILMHSLNVEVPSASLWTWSTTGTIILKKKRVYTLRAGRALGSAIRRESWYHLPTTWPVFHLFSYGKNAWPSAVIQ